MSVTLSVTCRLIELWNSVDRTLSVGFPEAQFTDTKPEISLKEIRSPRRSGVSRPRSQCRLVEFGSVTPRFQFQRAEWESRQAQSAKSVDCRSTELQCRELYINWNLLWYSTQKALVMCQSADRNSELGKFWDWTPWVPISPFTS